jgi:hypothetical protein
MTTKFYWHEDRRLVAVLVHRDIQQYITDHPALPPADEWTRVLPYEQNTPLYRVQGALLDRGAEPVLVFRALKQPVETMHWYGGLVNLVATIKQVVSAYKTEPWTA